METSVVLMSLFQTGTSISYSAGSNSYLSQGYVSMANNVYFNSIMFADGIIIKADIGQGYAYLFLNGISIYHTQSKKLIADRRFHNYCYSKLALICESTRILVEMLQAAMARDGKSIDINEAEAAIKKLISDSVNKNQLELANKECQRLLNS